MNVRSDISIYCVISQHPNKNDPSINLVSKAGFKKVEEKIFYEGLIFGIYEK